MIVRARGRGSGVGEMWDGTVNVVATTSSRVRSITAPYPPR